MTVIKIVFGMVESRFVDPIGGLLTKLIGGVVAVGTGPNTAVEKSPGVGTPPVVPKASTIR